MGGRRGTSWRVRLALTVVVASLTVGSCTGSGEHEDAGHQETANPSPAPPPLDRAALTRGIDDALGSSTGLYDRVRAVLVTQEGRPVVRLHYGPGARGPADLRDVTASVVGTLVGIAEADGLLDLDAPLSQLLPDYGDHMTAAVAAITLEQLLTMTSGLPGDADGAPFERGADWVAAILDLGVTGEPGTFVYSSAGSHLLAAVLTEATGTSLLDLARERLFEPLGVDPPVAWPADPQGVQLGYAGLELSADDLLALGRLYLDHGRRRDVQVVPEEWVREATTNHLELPDVSGMGFGYQWWTTALEDHEGFAALGSGGQVLEVVPDLALVAVATSEDRRSFVGPMSLLQTINDTVALQLG
ncbi:MAG: serine hydrolase [Nocardioides sp.]